MLITDKFVFIHLHKTGGRFIHSILFKLFPTARILGNHYPMEMIPNEYRHLPVLGVVRNPWEFYVSYYFFQKELIKQCEKNFEHRHIREYQSLIDRGQDLRNGIDLLFDFFSDYGTREFSETVYHFLNLGVDDTILNEVIEYMPTQQDQRGRYAAIAEAVRGMHVTRDALKRIQGTGDGFYTFLFKYLYGEPEKVYFCKTSSLREDLLYFLTNIGITVEQPIKDLILTSPRQNASSHQHYTEYYTPELKELVQERDRFILEKFEFCFSQ